MAHGAPQPDRIRYWPFRGVAALRGAGVPDPDRVVTDTDALLRSRWEARRRDGLDARRAG